MTVSEVCQWLSARFPSELAEEWDNTGLLLGRGDAKAKTVMTCLTLTHDVAMEAVEAGVDLIVAHHPVLFRGAKSITDATAEGRTILDLVAGEIAVYSPHTRFDSAIDGINAGLANALGLRNVRPLQPATEESSIGAGRCGDLAGPVSAIEFAKTVAKTCNVDGLHVVADKDQEVSRVAVACGAAGEFLKDAAEMGCDAFVVGEARFHTALEARDCGVALFVPGHYGTERGAVERLAGQISKAFPVLDCFASRVERDPLRWIS